MLLLRFLFPLCLLFSGSCELPPSLELYLERIELENVRSPEDRPYGSESESGPTTSTYRGMGSDVEQWRALVSVYFEPEAVDRALCLMSYESGGNPDAKNPRSSARGLFQILGSLWAPHFGVSPEDLYEPELNVRLAAEIFRLQGWEAWAPYNRGLCH